MFEQGVPTDQFHQFIASSRPSLPPPQPSLPSLPNSLHQHGLISFSNLHANTFNHAHHHHPSFLNPLQQTCSVTGKSSSSSESEKVHGDHAFMQMGRDIIRSVDDQSWSSEEVFALFKIRSSFENWFPDFTWDHVSRKLEELGFKRSPEKCREKFEEESCKYFNSNINYTRTSNYREFSDLDELYNNHEEHHHHHHEQEVQDQAENNASKTVKLRQSEQEGTNDKANILHLNFEDNSAADHDHCRRIDNDNHGNEEKNKKRKREERFEKFKGFCEDVVRQIVAKQEEIYNKLIEDMMRREEEKLAREEAWKKQELDRINKELEMRSHEQSLASEKQAKIIQFLNKFTPSTSTLTIPNPKPSSQSSSPNSPPNPNSHPLPTPTAQNPNIPPNTTPNVDSKVAVNDRDEIGKRWPKDEVLALINLKCNNTTTNEEKLEGGATKGVPLWERISQGMMELGYKRSAKRCKEKWENINKYFRKTRDLNKKRSIDSRTCPYFHQLNSLYNSNQSTDSEINQNHASAAVGSDHSGHHQSATEKLQ